MSSQEFVLHPSSSMQIAIHGRVVAQALSPPGNPDLRGRSHSITVYESAQGEIIASIEFHTEIEDELDFCLVERQLSVPEISDLLACQDPIEHIDRVQLRALNSNESARFLKTVVNDYDLLAAEIESQLCDFEPCESPQSSPNEQAETKSVLSGWNPFGIGEY